MNGTPADELPRLSAAGLTFSDCVRHFGSIQSPALAAYRAAVPTEEGVTEVDADAIVSESGGGAYVMTWTYVDDQDLELDTLAEETLGRTAGEPPAPVDEPAGQGYDDLPKDVQARVDNTWAAVSWALTVADVTLEENGPAERALYAATIQAVRESVAPDTLPERQAVPTLARVDEVVQSLNKRGFVWAAASVREMFDRGTRASELVPSLTEGERTAIRSYGYPIHAYRMAHVRSRVAKKAPEA